MEPLNSPIPAMFEFVKAYMKKKSGQASLCWYLEPNLGQETLCNFIKNMKISSKSDSLSSISQSGFDFEKNCNKFLGFFLPRIRLEKTTWKQKVRILK